jgi:hypothetical protein
MYLGREPRIINIKTLVNLEAAANALPARNVKFRVKKKRPPISANAPIFSKFSRKLSMKLYHYCGDFTSRR